MMQKQTGTVARFDHGKGYGFIQRDGDGHDIFLHNSNFIDPVQGEIGMRVQFNFAPGRDGRMRAMNVRRA